MSASSRIQACIYTKFREPLRSQYGILVSQQIRFQVEWPLNDQLIRTIQNQITHQLLQEIDWLTQP